MQTKYMKANIWGNKNFSNPSMKRKNNPMHLIAQGENSHQPTIMGPNKIQMEAQTQKYLKFNLEPCIRNPK